MLPAPQLLRAGTRGAHICLARHRWSAACGGAAARRPQGMQASAPAGHLSHHSLCSRPRCACQLGEWFGYIKNELYSDLFPAHAGLKGRASAGKAAGGKAVGGKAAAVTAQARVQAQAVAA